MYRESIRKCYEPLSVGSVKTIAKFILSGDILPEESASLLTALNFQKDEETLLSGFAQVLKEQTHSFNYIPGCIDVCGTGGDGHHTFNISSTVSLLLSTQMPIAKHGNTSITSKCGSADVVKALNLPLYEDPRAIEASLKNNHFVFLYAPYLHQKMKHVMPIRRKLNIPTIFNKVGPLCNPFQLDYQIIGVFEESLMMPMAKAMQSLNIKRGAVVHGHLGMDELSATGLNKIIYVYPSSLVEDTIDPLDYAIQRSKIEDYVGGTVNENARITQDILSGIKGPKQDIVALNAGLGFYIGEISNTLSEGIQLAYALLNSGEGIKQLNLLREEISCQF
ncbi:MAG: anthranilate phosphoribosyltransferase [Clostridia bacterium]|nr:anthranilate phosphoribosyltransferase [Clostridia bacterium]